MKYGISLFWNSHIIGFACLVFLFGFLGFINLKQGRELINLKKKLLGVSSRSKSFLIIKKETDFLDDFIKKSKKEIQAGFYGNKEVLENGFLEKIIFEAEKYNLLIKKCDISDKKITFLGDYSNLVNFLKSFNFLKSLYFCDHITITKSDALLHIDYMYDKHNLIKL